MIYEAVISDWWPIFTAHHYILTMAISYVAKKWRNIFTIIQSTVLTYLFNQPLPTYLHSPICGCRGPVSALGFTSKLAACQSLSYNLMGPIITTLETMYGICAHYLSRSFHFLTTLTEETLPNIPVDHLWLTSSYLWVLASKLISNSLSLSSLSIPLSILYVIMSVLVILSSKVITIQVTL